MRSAFVRMLVGILLTALTWTSSAQFTTIQDIGAPIDAGSIVTNGPGSYTLTAGGNEMWGTQDQGFLALYNQTGDFDVRVRAESVSAANRWSKVGLQLREDPNAIASHTVFTYVTPPDVPAADGGNGVNGQYASWRTLNGGVSGGGANGGEFETFGANPAYPNAWMRLSRSGNIVRAYHSANGLTWNLFETVNMDDVAGAKAFSTPIPSAAYLGFAASSHNNNGVLPKVTAELRDFGSPSNAVLVTRDPQNTTRFVGQTATFSFGSAGGYDFLAIQWRSNGVDIAGATAPTYTTPVLSLANGGEQYSVFVSNTVDSSTAASAAGTLTVLDLPQLVSVGSLYDVQHTNIYVRFDKDMNATAVNPANYQVNSGAIVVGTAEFHNGNPRLIRIGVTTPLVMGSSYAVRVSGVQDSSGNPLFGDPVTQNFTHLADIKLQGLSMRRFDGSGDFATVVNKIATCAAPQRESTTMPDFEYTTSGAGIGDVANGNLFGDGDTENYGTWIYGQFAPPVTGNYTFGFAADDHAELFLSTDSSPANKVMITAQPSWNCYRGFAANCGDTLAPQVTVSLVAGKTYYMEAIHAEGGGGDHVAVAVRKPGDPALVNGGASVSRDLFATNYFFGCPPAKYFDAMGPVAIVQQPVNATVIELASVTFSVKINGSPLLSVAPYYNYQWYSNGVPVPGATSASLTYNPLRYANGATYTVVAANGFSSVTSAPAVLTVISDEIAPLAVRSYGGAVFTNVTIEFNEAVDIATGTNPANYSITNDAGAALTVLSASIRNNTNVVLLTAAQVSGDHYTVVLNNVADRAGVPNPIAANSTVGFTAWVFTPGVALMETYNAGGGNDVAILTGHPTYPYYPRERFYIKGIDSRLAYPGNEHEAYGGRISGLFLPPVSDLIVYLASDDASELRASLDENPANSGSLTAEPGCCNPFSAHQAPLTGLTPGNRYYFEALWKEGGGGDFVQVSVDGTTPANGQYLGVYANPDDATLNIVTPPADQTKLEGQVGFFTVAATASIAGVLPNPSYFQYQWFSNGVPIAGATAASYQTPSLTFDNDQDVYTVITWIPGKASTNSATLTVIEDVIPPTLVKATTDQSFLRIFLEFSEALSPAAAGEASSYGLFDSLGVAGGNQINTIGAVIQTNGSNVIIYLTEPLGVASNYVMATAGQYDLFGNATEVDPVEISFQAWDIACGFVKFEAYLGLNVPDYQNPQPVEDAVNNGVTPSFQYFTNNVNWPQSNPGLDNYGMRFYGWFRAPVTGNYKFEPAHDDSGHLYFSTDASPTNATLVMDFDCCSGFGSGEAGATIAMVAGQDYYFDLRVVEAGGGDYAGLSVTLPDNTYLAPIPASYLVFYASPETGAATLTGFVSNPASVTIAENSSVTFSVTVTSSVPVGVFYKWEVNNGGGWTTIAGANSASYTTPLLPLSANGAQYRAIASVPGLNLPSAVATVTITNDITPPVVLVARATGPRTIELVFNEPVSALSAGEISNYEVQSLDGLLVIDSAQLVGDGTRVRLNMSAALPCEYIIVRMGGIEDMATTPNAMGLAEIGFINFGLEHRYTFNNGAGSANGGVLTDVAGGANGAVRGNGATFTGSRLSITGGGSGTAPYGDLPNGLVSKHSTNNAGSGAMTIETWVKVTGNQNWGRIFDIGSTSGNEINGPGGGGNGWRYVMLAGQVGGDVNNHRFELSGEGAGAFPNGFTSDFPATFNTDTHLVVTWDENNHRIQIYKNGDLVLNRDTPALMSDVQDVNVWLGRSTWTGDNNMQGEYDEFRVYQRALSASEVSLSRNLGPNDHLSLPLAVSLSVPTNTVLENVFQQGTVLANFASSNGVDITAVPCYRIFSSSPSVVSVQPNGGLQALVPGTSDLTVTYGGITSSVVTITVLPDTTAPVALSARALNNPSQIEVQFSELMAATGLGEISNFEVRSPSGVLAIASTASAGDGSRALITMVNPLPCEIIYVSMGGLTDRATSPNTLVPNPTTLSFLNYGLEHRYTFNNAAGPAADQTVVTDVIGGANGRVRGAGSTFTGSRVTLPGGASSTAGYIDLPNGLLSKHSVNNGGSGKFTIEGWTKVTGNWNWARIFDFGNSTVGENAGPGGGGDGQDYLFYSAQEGGNVNRHVAVVREVNNAPDGSTLNVETSVGFDTTFNTDIHFVLTWDESTGQVRVYENGAFKGGFGTVAPMSKIADVNVWLGRSQWSGDQNMQGEFDDVRIYNRILGDSEIAINGQLGADQPASQPIALRLDIPSTTVTENVFQQAVVRADYPSTANVNITALGCYTIVSDNPSVVTVTPGAGLQAGDPGTANVTVTFGGLTNSYLVTVLVDNTKPTIVSVEGVRQFNAVKVTFSERVSAATAQNLDNYILEDISMTPITIISATLGADERTVILSIPTHDPGETLVLNAAGVQDIANTPNTMNFVVNYAFKTWVLSCGFASFEAYLNLFVPDYQNPQPVIDAVNNGVTPSFQFYTNVANWPQSTPDINNYGMRVYGLFRAPATGTYKFEPAHDDSGHLYFSTDNTESNAVLAMDFDCCSGFGAGEAGYFVNLTAGQSYWFDLRVVEAGGGDYAGLAVTLPDNTYLAPIPARFLAVPVPPNGYLAITNQPDNVTIDLAASGTGGSTFVTVDFNANNGGFVASAPLATDGPWTYDNGSGSWKTAGQAGENGHANTVYLTSPAIPVPASGNLRLSFDHRYSFEGGAWDGGQVRFSVNGGPFNTVPAAAFLQNGYNGTVLGNSSSAAAGQAAFIEESAGHDVASMITSVCDLGNFTAGDSVQVQFVAASDSNSTGDQPVWEITSGSLISGGQSFAAIFSVGTTATNAQDGANPPRFYQWYRNGVEIPGANSAIYGVLPCIADNGAQYYAKVSIVGENPVTSASATLTVINPASVAVNSVTTCEGGSGVLTAVTDARNPSYLWSPGGQTTASVTNAPGVTTEYTVTVTDGVTLCSYSAQGTITVIPLHQVSVVGNGTSICHGESVVLTATTDAVNPTFLWSPGGQTTQSVTNSPGSTTTYTVTVTDGVTGCQNSANATVTIHEFTFANVNPITINDNAAASPNPSTIVVSGLDRLVCRVAVTLSNINHAYPADIDVLLVGPGGQKIRLMSDAGDFYPLTGEVLTFSDFAAGTLPDEAQIVSGTYLPSNYENKADIFPGGPSAPYGALLSALNNTDPNGTWSLFVVDDEAGDSGAITGGWALHLTVLTPFADVAVSSSVAPNPVAVGTNVTFTITVVNNGPATAEANSVLGSVSTNDLSFVSITSSQGSATYLDGSITAALGNLAPSASATITLVLSPTATGTITNGVSVSSSTFDLNLANNSAGTTATVLNPVVLVTGPVSQTNCSGANVLFSVAVTGDEPISYQWYSNGVAIAGATTTSISFSNSTTDLSATYSVAVSNAVSALSASADLLVNQTPSLVVNGAATVCPGTPVILDAVTDSANPLYLWSPGGATTASITNAPGVTTVYTVVVTDAINGCTNAASATITVNTLTSITALGNKTNCPGSAVTFTTTASGTGPFIYVWRKDGNIVQGPDANNSYNLASVVSGDAGVYTVEVTGACNSVTNSGNLVVVGLPVIAAQPQSQTVPMGNGAVFTFNTTSHSVAPISYVWTTNGTEVTGVTGSSLAISNLTLAQSGMLIQATASNCAGTVASAVAILTVSPISGISFDFNTPGQYTNAPFNLFGNDWANSTLVNVFHFGPVIPHELSTGGVGTATGSGVLDLSFNNGNANSSTLHPLSYDFSLPGKTLVASVMIKIKVPLGNNRNTQLGFTTATNLDLDNSAGRSYMTLLLQSLAQPAPNFEVRTGSKPNGANTFQEGNNTGSIGLLTNNWYKLTATFVNNSAVTPGTYLLSGTLEDYGTNGLQTPVTVITRSAVTITNVDVVASKKLHLVLRGIENSGIDYWDNVHVYTTNGPIYFVQEPASQTIKQGRTASFSALVDGQGPYTYQWFKNGSPIDGAGNWKYGTPQMLISDNGATYQVVVSSALNSITSAPVTLTVNSDTLDVLSAGSVDGSLVGVRFNQPVNQASAENPANYSINGQPALSAKLRVFNPLNPMQQLRTNQTEVLLVPATEVSGAFTVVVSGVTSLSGDAVSGNNTANGEVIGLTSLDVDPAAAQYNGLLANPGFQFGTTPGTTYSFAPGQIELSSAGHDIFGNFDGFRFAFKQVTGDFDYIVHIPYQDAFRTPNKAGFNARVSLDPMSPNVGAYVNPALPGRNFYEGGRRELFNNASASWGANTTTVYPNVWLRFRRVANTFIRYSSTNGVIWNCDGTFSPSPAFPETLYVGIAGNCNVGAGVIQELVTSQYDSLGNGPTYPGATIAITGQPQSQTVAAGGNVTFGVTNTVTGGGIPASGEVFYLWQRTNALSGGWTNLIAAGNTNRLVTAGPLLGSDNGALFRVILTAAGALSVTSDVVSVTITDAAAPTVATVFAPTNSAGTFIVRFSEDVSEATALNAANYRLTNLLNGTVYTINGASFLGADRRTVVLTTTTTLDSAPRYSLGVSGIQDLGGNTIAVATPIFPVSGAAGRNPVVIDYYGSLATAANLSDLTNNIKFINNAPDWTVYSNSFQVNGGQTGFPTSGLGDNYGARMYSYFVAPSNSQYTFWWRADDFSRFFMNTNPVNSTSYVGRVGSFTTGAANASYQLTNRFVTPPLTAGQKYYVEFLFKEGGGGDGGVLMVDMGTGTTVPAATVVAPSYLWAFPDAVAPQPKMITELYSGLANIGQSGQGAGAGQAYGNGNLNDLFFVTNFQNVIVGNPSIMAYEKYSAYSTNLGNTSVDNYFGRIYGYFVPPTNGNYRFYTRSDDASALYMNTNAVNSTDPMGKVLLRGQFAYTNATTLWPAPVSVSLIGGQHYYLEGQWREGGGGDGLSIAVRGAGELAPNALITSTYLELIPNNMLVFPTNLDRFGPIGFAQAGLAGGIAPANPTVTDGQSLKFQARGLSGSLPYLGFTWTKNGQIMMMNSAYWVTPPLTLADNGAVVTLTVTNLFSSTTITTIVSVLPDNTAPTIVNAEASQYGNTVVVTFSEDVEYASAGSEGNYSIAGLTVYSAVRDDVRGDRVTLRTSPQAPGTTYTLVVHGVKDLSTGGNPTVSATKNFSTWGYGGIGAVFVEAFYDLPNSTVDALIFDPKFVNNTPDETWYTNVFAVGQFAAHSGRENWAARLSGYFMPPSNGLYQFYIRGDDGTRFYMNTNGSDANGKVQLARNDGANSATIGSISGYQTGLGLGYVGASMTPILSLTNGTPYYMEGIMKEGGGGDYMTVVMRAIDPGTGLPTVALPLTPAAVDAVGGGFFQATGDPENIALTPPPSELTVTENDPVTLTVSAISTPANLASFGFYQWQRTNEGSGTFTNIPGATSGSYSFFAKLGDDSAHFRVVASFPGAIFTPNTLMHVLTDTIAPSMVSASARPASGGIQMVGVLFSEPVDALTALEPSNYQATDEDGTIVSFTSAQFRPGFPNQVLLVADGVSAPDGFLIGDIQMLSLAMPDLAAVPNVAMDLLSATGAVQVLDEQIVGAPGVIAVGGYNTLAPGLGFSGAGATTGAFTYTNGGWDVSANGWDIWNTADGFLFLQRTVSGNFDIKTRIQTFTGADQWSKAGLMARGSTNANSRMFFMGATPATTPIGGQLPNNFFSVQYREVDGRAPASFSNTNAPSYPNAWVRLQRSNSVFYGFWSTNNVDWTLLTQLDTAQNLDGPFPDTLVVGLATVSHDQTRSLANNAYLEYRDLYFPAPASISVQPTPSLVVTGIHQSVTFSGLVAGGGDGPITYQWRKNGLPIAGANSDTYTIPNTAVADSGTYTVLVANNGGGTISTDCILIVTNGLPSVTGENIALQQGSLTNILPADLLANDSDPELDPLSITAVSGVFPVTFTSTFPTGAAPAGVVAYGATFPLTGGNGGDGYVLLNGGAASQAGSIVLDELTPNKRVSAFTASFRMKVADWSAEAADGMSFNFADNLPLSATTPLAAENGGGTGFSFVYDSYRFAPFAAPGTPASAPGGGTANTSGFKLIFGGTNLIGVQTPTWTNATEWIPVTITVTESGAVTVLVDGTNVFGNYTLPGWTPRVGRFGIYGRTGGAFESHGVDDLSVTVRTLDTARGYAISGASLYGNSRITGVINQPNSGSLHLTEAAIGQAGSYIINELTPGNPVTSFNASFKLRIGNGSGNAADGFSLNFAGDLPNAAAGLTVAEEGVGTGLSFAIDNYPTGGADSPSLKLKTNGVLAGFVKIPKWNNTNFIPVNITLAAGGAVTVNIDGTNVIAGFPTAYTPINGRFGFFARTGGEFETHWVDDIAISVTTAGPSASYSENFNSGGPGTVVLTNGLITYNPVDNACGDDSFYYLVSDGQQGGDVWAQVTVTITPTNGLLPSFVACAGNRTVSLDTNCQYALPSLIGDAIVSGNCVVVTQSPLAGTLFGAGPTVVTLTATDSQGNFTTCNVTVTGVDTTAPTLAACPADITTPQTGPAGAVVTFSVPSALDNCDGAPTVLSSHVSGSTFPPGATTVTVTAYDVSGNTNTCTFIVTVTPDAVAPTINCPTNMVIACAGTNATATYVATATDNVDANPTVIVTPPSGSTFPLGTNIVLVTAYDVAGNTNTCTFEVVVTDPAAENISLSVVPSGTNVVLTWPQTCTPFALQCTTNLLQSNTVWSAVGTLPTPVGNSFQLTLPATESQKYFRLLKQ